MGEIGLLGSLGILFATLFGFLVLAATIFWIWMLVEALMNEPTTNDKILWFLVIFFLHFLGAFIYFLVRKVSRTGPTCAV